MTKYDPLDIGISIVASKSDLAKFSWNANGIEAHFVLPDSTEQLLRVRFDRECIVRLLDEMPMSTEDDHTGLVPEHFAYRVYGAKFERIQSASWREINRPVTHYQFITGWACMDVISAASPSFDVVSA